jgi:hypothetical protein
VCITIKKEHRLGEQGLRRLENRVVARGRSTGTPPTPPPFYSWFSGQLFRRCERFSSTSGICFVIDALHTVHYTICPQYWAQQLYSTFLIYTFTVLNRQDLLQTLPLRIIDQAGQLQY